MRDCLNDPKINILEYLKEPQPWFNTDCYEPWQIIMFVIGALLWVIVYVDTIRDIFKKQTLNIPFGAVITNYGWEISAAIFVVPNMGKALVIGYWAWMVLDTVIFYNTIKLAHKQCRVDFFKKHLTPLLLILCLAISMSTQLTFIQEYDIPMAPVSANIINLYMSIAFVYMVFIPNFEGNSLVTGWAKFLGTLIINIMFSLKYP